MKNETGSDGNRAESVNKWICKLQVVGLLSRKIKRMKSDIFKIYDTK